jgi:hypothetical protein
VNPLLIRKGADAKAATATARRAPIRPVHGTPTGSSTGLRVGTPTLPARIAPDEHPKLNACDATRVGVLGAAKAERVLGGWKCAGHSDFYAVDGTRSAVVRTRIRSRRGRGWRS